MYYYDLCDLMCVCIYCTVLHKHMCRMPAEADCLGRLACSTFLQPTAIILHRSHNSLPPAPDKRRFGANEAKPKVSQRQISGCTVANSWIMKSVTKALQELP